MIGNLYLDILIIVFIVLVYLFFGACMAPGIKSKNKKMQKIKRIIFIFLWLPLLPFIIIGLGYLIIKVEVLKD